MPRKWNTQPHRGRIVEVDEELDMVTLSTNLEHPTTESTRIIPFN